MGRRSFWPKHVITKQDRQMRLPWWGVLLVITGTIPLLLMFDRFGRDTFARPTLYSIAIIAITVALRWKLKRQVWFWSTIAFFGILHLSLILLIPWTTKWIPALVITPIGIADSYAMLWVIALIEIVVERSKAAQREQN